MKKGNTRSFLNRLSIQQRLTILICTLLLSAIVIYGFANYYTLKKASLTIARDRISLLTTQISTMFGQSAQAVIKTEHAIAAQNSVVECVKSGGKEFRNEAVAELDKLHKDSTWVSIDLLDQNGAPVLRSDKSTVNVDLNTKRALAFTHVGADSGKVGRIYIIRGSMCYPAVATVVDKTRIIGYVICWQMLRVTPKAVAQFTQLIGVGTELYIVNADGTLWTNLVKPVTAQFKIDRMGGPIEYTGPNGPMIAKVQPVPNTGWLVAIAFSEQNILEGVNSFMKWVFIFGALLTALGIFAVWMMSRNITRPLNLLTIAAKAISEGNYTSPKFIEVYRDDELGELANAFNIMTAEVYHVWQNLDSEVKQRTSQLERVNKELEAFSYSVSHDLRTPLRAVSGYSIMLKEDYDDKLDAEGKRIIGNIITNARMMGQLIDDLLAFSRLGKKELSSTKIDMQMLAISVVNELLQNDLDKDYKINVGILPPVEGDPVMIKQALINLVGNAIKYSSKKAKPAIEIGAEDEETRIIYYVKDNGVGFDMAYAGKLFGVFQRLHSQEEFEGTGVGLALVKRIIDKHNGEVWADGQENAGATFYFSLPKK